MELINKINNLNKEVKKLNNERNVALGKKETLTQQLHQSLADYNAKFQANISVDTIEAELTKVSDEVEAAVAKLETAITQIKSGNFTEANATLDIKTEEFSESVSTEDVTPEVAEKVEEVVEKVEETVEQPSTVNEPSVSTEESPAPVEKPAPDASSFLDMLNITPDEPSAQTSASVEGGISPAAPAAPEAPAAPKVELPPTNFTTFMGV